MIEKVCENCYNVGLQDGLIRKSLFTLYNGIEKDPNKKQTLRAHLLLSIILYAELVWDGSDVLWKMIKKREFSHQVGLLDALIGNALFGLYNVIKVESSNK